VLDVAERVVKLEGGEWSAARPGRTLPPGKDPVPVAQEAGWAPGAGLDGRKNFVPTGIRSRTVVSCYTDRATRPLPVTVGRLKLFHTGEVRYVE